MVSPDLLEMYANAQRKVREAEEAARSLLEGARGALQFVGDMIVSRHALTGADKIDLTTGVITRGSADAGE